MILYFIFVCIFKCITKQEIQQSWQTSALAMHLRGAFKKFVAWQMDTRELNDIMPQVTTNHYYLLAQVIIGVTYLWWFYSMVFRRKLLLG